MDNNTSYETNFLCNNFYVTNNIGKITYCFHMWIVTVCGKGHSRQQAILIASASISASS